MTDAEKWQAIRELVKELALKTSPNWPIEEEAIFPVVVSILKHSAEPPKQNFGRAFRAANSKGRPT